MPGSLVYSGFRQHVARPFQGRAAAGLKAPPYVLRAIEISASRARAA